MSRRRKIMTRPIDPKVYQSLQNFPVFLRRLYASRAIKSHEELDYQLTQLPAPTRMHHVNEAACALADAIESKQKLLVLGDFDADGATSTSVCVSALKALGATEVDYLVPNRFEFGYGLSEAIVEVAYKQYRPDWIITVDNGIANHAGVLKAKSLGMRVLITDHHLPGETLPDADIIVNPSLTQCAFPSKALAGVGVIYYVMLALRAELEQRNWFASRDKPNMTQFLDLVTLGTVADLVPLDHVNRLLVAQGLMRMRNGMIREGLRALLDVAGVDHTQLTTRDLGFGLGPRLNAAGRLEDMSIGIACLLETDPLLAKQKAQTLNELNEKRKQIESEMKQMAFDELDALFDNQTVPFGISLHHPDWHQGVIGILAGRIKDKYLRPTIIFASGDNDELKGSARSVPGLHIRDLLAELNVMAPHIITKFGGHAMAAGLSIQAKYFDEFSKLFDQLVARSMSVEALEGALYVDGALTEAQVSLETIGLLETSGPWGQQFPAPLFCNECTVKDVRVVGQKHLKLKVQFLDANKVFDAIWFNPTVDLDVIEKEDQIELVYDLAKNEYQGMTSVQLLVTHINIEQEVVA